MKHADILIVDDNPASLDFMLELLKNYDVRAVTGAVEAREAIAEQHPDLILLDIMMPDVDGFAFCSELKSSRVTRNIPVIFLTASTDSKDIEHALSIGGVDYITKPYQPEVVSLRIKTQLEIVSLKSKLEMCQRMDDLSLTKKKEAFNAEAKHWFTYAMTEEKVVTIAAISICNLRAINAVSGFEAADHMIKSAAQHIRERAKKNMLVGRFGGGLFLILVYGVSAGQFKATLAALKSSIGKISIPGQPQMAPTIETHVNDSTALHKYSHLLNDVLAHTCGDASVEG